MSKAWSRPNVFICGADYIELADWGNRTDHCTVQNPDVPAYTVDGLVFVHMHRSKFSYVYENVYACLYVCIFLFS